MSSDRISYIDGFLNLYPFASTTTKYSSRYETNIFTCYQSDRVSQAGANILNLQIGIVVSDNFVKGKSFAEELVKMGVPKDDIVLGLHPPYKRQYTEYGVA